MCAHHRNEHPAGEPVQCQPTDERHAIGSVGHGASVRIDQSDTSAATTAAASGSNSTCRTGSPTTATILRECECWPSAAAAAAFADARTSASAAAALQSDGNALRWRCSAAAPAATTILQPAATAATSWRTPNVRAAGAAQHQVKPPTSILALNLTISS